MTTPTISLTRDEWERQIALSATRFSAVMILGRRRIRAEFDTMAEAIAWRPEGDYFGKPLVYAIAPPAAPGCSQRSVHLDNNLIAFLKENGR